MSDILIVDDERDIRELISEILIDDDNNIFIDIYLIIKIIKNIQLDKFNKIYA